MSDVAMAARAECLMLNNCPNVDEAISTLRDLLRRMMKHQSKKTSRLGALHSR
jgi:pyruvate kinase